MSECHVTAGHVHESMMAGLCLSVMTLSFFVVFLIDPVVVLSKSAEEIDCLGAHLNLQSHAAPATLHGPMRILRPVELGLPMRWTNHERWKLSPNLSAVNMANNGRKPPFFLVGMFPTSNLKLVMERRFLLRIAKASFHSFWP